MSREKPSGDNPDPRKKAETSPRKMIPSERRTRSRPKEILEKNIEAHAHGETPASRSFLYDYLGKYESYSPESRVTCYVQSRLDYITEGREAEVIVVHNDTPNAFAIPGMVVVHDGLLELAEYQEEIDGILGHEWTHLSEGHVHGTQENDSLFARLGEQRKHEAMADFKPVEILDQRGINPAGLLTMFAKMERWQEQQIAEEIPGQKESDRRKKIIARADPIHGSLLDRRLQLSDAGKFVDVRNLSNDFTPLPVTPEDLQGYAKDTDLWDHFPSLSRLEKRQFLQRQFRNTLSTDYSQGIDPEQTTKLRQLVAWQRELLADTTPGLTNEELTERTNASIYLGFDIQRLGYYDEEGERWIDISHSLVPAGIDIQSWYDSYDSSAKVQRLFALLEDESFQHLGIDLGANKHALYDVARKVFSSYLQSQEQINIADYVRLVNDTGVVEKAVSPGNNPETLLYAPLLPALKQKGRYSEQSMEELAAVLAGTSLSQSQIETTLAATLPAMDVPEEVRSMDVPIQDIQRIKRYDPVGAMLISHFRSNKIRAIETASDDPLRLFTSDPVHEHSEKVAEVVREHFSIERTLAFVADYQESYQESLPDEVRREIIRVYEDIFYQQLDPTRGEYPRIKNQSEFESHMKIWALAPDKRTYLANVKRDLALLFESRKRSSRELEKLADSIIQTPIDAARRFGNDAAWEVSKEDFAELSPLMDATIEKAFEKADMLQNSTHITELVRTVPAFNTKDKRWDAVVTQFVEGNISLNDPDVAEKLFALGVTTDNSHILLEVPSKAAEAYVANTDFDEGVRFLFDTYGHMPRHLFDQALNYLIEEKARTPEEFEQLEKQVRGEIQKIFSDDTNIGELAVSDAFVLDQLKTQQSKREKVVGIKRDTVSGVDTGELLEAMLASGESDDRLKRLLLERWWIACRLGPQSVQDYFDIEGGMTTFRHPGKDLQFGHWAHEVPASYTSFSDVVSNIQLANTAMKVATLRKVLTGEGGVLASDEKKRAFVETFLSEKIDLSEEGESNMTSELLQSLMEVGEQEELYHQLSPILQGMILGVPDHPTELRVFAREKGRELLADLERRMLIKDPTDRDRIHLTRKIYSLMTGGRKDEVAQDLSSADKQLLSLVAEEREQEHAGKLTPWELAIRVGKASGALGTRTLQLAGQYFDIPEDEKENVMDVYDNVHGQSRLQAYRVLKREAGTNPEMAEFMENVAEIRQRIGGGSLMTVYDFLFKDGSREAVGVRNPNVTYTLNKSVDLVQRTVDKAKDTNPDERNYQLLGVLVGDVQQWIHDELTDPRFEEKDRLFREQNDSRYGNFDTSAHRYDILVPQSKPTGTRWVRRDEYIEGKNLTSLSVTEGETNIAEGQINTEDYRDAVSVLAKNYFHQLATGLVHPDIHPGNFRITLDNRNVAIFDRYNLLELSDRDQEFISNMFGAFGAGDSHGVSQHFVDYLLELDENSGHRQKREALIANVANTMQGGMMDSLIALKQQGVKVPYQIGLIGRGLQVFDTMSKHAGYQNLIGALSA